MDIKVSCPYCGHGHRIAGESIMQCLSHANMVQYHIGLVYDGGRTEDEKERYNTAGEWIQQWKNLPMR